MSNKKGISDVVTTVLIVLLSVVAVAAVGYFLLPMITKSGTQISQTQSCLNVNLEVTGCKYAGTTGLYNVTVKRATADSESLTGVRFIFTKVDGSTLSPVDSSTVPGVLGTVVYPSVNAGASASGVSVSEGISAGGVVSYCASSTPVNCA